MTIMGNIGFEPIQPYGKRFTVFPGSPTPAVSLVFNHFFHSNDILASNFLMLPSFFEGFLENLLSCDILILV